MVFPEGMSVLDINNSSKSLKTIEDYIRYMQERIDFSISHLKADYIDLTGAISWTDLDKGTQAIISAAGGTLSLSVTNGEDSSVIKLMKDGIDISSQTIKFTGDIIFKSNLTDGTTTISGDNIKTGTISAVNVNLGNGKLVYNNTTKSLTFGSDVKLVWRNLPNDVAATDDIPTALSELTNDEGFIDSSALPTKLSELTNDEGFIDISAIPTKLSEFLNDEGFIDADGQYIKNSTAFTQIADTWISTKYIVADSVVSSWVYSGSIKANQIQAGTISAEIKMISPKLYLGTTETDAYLMIGKNINGHLQVGSPNGDYEDLNAYGKGDVFVMTNGATQDNYAVKIGVISSSYGDGGIALKQYSKTGNYSGRTTNTDRFLVVGDDGYMYATDHTVGEIGTAVFG